MQVKMKERFTMTGLKQTMNKYAILNALKQAPEQGDFFWDGITEDERPLSKKEMQSAIKLGRPKADVTKDRITLRVSKEVTSYFRGTGKGWQTRMNNVLTSYVKAHR